MTVADLIEQLEHCPGDLEVKVYDDGIVCGVKRVVGNYRVGSMPGYQLTVVLLESDLLG